MNVGGASFRPGGNNTERRGILRQRQSPDQQPANRHSVRFRDELGFNPVFEEQLSGVSSRVVEPSSKSNLVYLLENLSAFMDGALDDLGEDLMSHKGGSVHVDSIQQDRSEQLSSELGRLVDELMTDMTSPIYRGSFISHPQFSRLQSQLRHFGTLRGTFRNYSATYEAFQAAKQAGNQVLTDQLSTNIADMESEMLAIRQDYLDFITTHQLNASPDSLWPLQSLPDAPGQMAPTPLVFPKHLLTHLERVTRFASKIKTLKDKVDLRFFPGDQVNTILSEWRGNGHWDSQDDALLLAFFRSSPTQTVEDVALQFGNSLQLGERESSVSAFNRTRRFSDALSAFTIAIVSETSPTIKDSLVHACHSMVIRFFSMMDASAQQAYDLRSQQYDAAIQEAQAAQQQTRVDELRQHKQSELAQKSLDGLSSLLLREAFEIMAEIVTAARSSYFASDLPVKPVSDHLADIENQHSGGPSSFHATRTFGRLMNDLNIISRHLSDNGIDSSQVNFKAPFQRLIMHNGFIIQGILKEIMSHDPIPGSKLMAFERYLGTLNFGGANLMLTSYQGSEFETSLTEFIDSQVNATAYEINTYMFGLHFDSDFVDCFDGGVSQPTFLAAKEALSELLFHEEPIEDESEDADIAETAIRAYFESKNLSHVCDLDGFMEKAIPLVQDREDLIHNEFSDYRKALIRRDPAMRKALEMGVVRLSSALSILKRIRPDATIDSLLDTNFLEFFNDYLEESPVDIAPETLYGQHFKLTHRPSSLPPTPMEGGPRSASTVSSSAPSPMGSSTSSSFTQGEPDTDGASTA